MDLTDLMIKVAAEAAMGPDPAAAGGMDPNADPSMMEPPPDPIAEDNQRLQSLLENLQLRSQVMAAQQDLAMLQRGGNPTPTAGNKVVEPNSEKPTESNPVTQAGIKLFHDILEDSGIVRTTGKDAAAPAGAATATKQNQDPGQPTVTTGSNGGGNASR